MSSAEIDFSVVLPVYNCNRFLTVCHDSLARARRRFKNGIVQFVWVNDGSTDGSGVLLDSFLEPSDHDIVIHQKNAGVSAARNVGIVAAEGRWLMFLDPDDIYHPDVFCHLYNIVSQYDVDVVKFGYRRTNRHIMEWAVPSTPVVELFNLTVEKEFASAWSHHLVKSRMWNGCYRRCIFKRLQFRCIPNGEDGLFAQECLGKIQSLALTDSVLYSYLQSAQSATQMRNLPMTEGHILYNRHCYEIAIGWPFFQAIHSGFKRAMRSSVGGSSIGLILSLASKDRKTAWSFFMSNLKDVFVEPYVFNGIERRLYAFAFKAKSPTLLLLFLRFPWWIRKTLLQVSLVRRIKRICREER